MCKLRDSYHIQVETFVTLAVAFHTDKEENDCPLHPME